MDVNEIRQSVLDGCPRSLTELCVQCCAQDPEFRPSADVASDWLHSILNDLHEEIVVPKKGPARRLLSPRREGNVVFPHHDTSSVRTVAAPLAGSVQGMDLHGRVALLEMYTQQLLTENARLKHELQQMAAAVMPTRQQQLLANRRQHPHSAHASPAHTHQNHPASSAADEALTRLAERIGILETKFDSIPLEIRDAVQDGSELSEAHRSTADDTPTHAHTRPHSVSVRRKQHQGAHKRTPTFPLMMNRSMSHDSMISNPRQTPSPAPGSNAGQHRRQVSMSHQSIQPQQHWSQASLQETRRSDHGKSSPLLTQPGSSVHNQTSRSSPFAEDPPSPLISTQLLLSDEEGYSSSETEAVNLPLSPRKVRASLGMPAANVSLYGALNWEELPPKDSRKSVGDSPSNRRAFVHWKGGLSQP